MKTHNKQTNPNPKKPQKTKNVLLSSSYITDCRTRVLAIMGTSLGWRRRMLVVLETLKELKRHGVKGVDTLSSC